MVKMINFMRMLPIIFLKSVRFLFLVMYQFYSGFLSYSFPEVLHTIVCLLSTYYVSGTVLSALLFVLPHLTLKAFLLPSLFYWPETWGPESLVGELGFESWYSRELTISHWPQRVLVTLQSAISYSLLKSLIDLLIETLICILLTSLVGFLSTLEVRLII